MIEKSSPWHSYALQDRPSRSGSLPPPERFEWGTAPGMGPGTPVLGQELRRRRILELGCGYGRNAAHLAGLHGAEVTAVDLVDLQIKQANESYGRLAGLTFVTFDALDFLNLGRSEFDVVYSVFGAVGLVSPSLLLAAVARRLRRQGILAFSVPHPSRGGIPRARGAQPRPDLLPLPGGPGRPVARWELDEQGWRSALGTAGMRIVRTFELGTSPRAQPNTLMIVARRN
ncbi:bifunctional 2-polyprenyl-6-hydroxyphenol methylase/3-demethylubiquinol 3-O-methyltransferase UbiG [Kitasatospora sp. MBT66]|uniref:class I SAM-dependent methyltransferase n=1 Tax=Kitasatospora sp. MBT66 TaxID=1444769 RepID=UPI0005B84B8E|nr:class I SAM-dependent methyltransferase [Kitasatospora sp. MBT66]